MTLILEIPAEVEASFQSAASQRGVSVQEFLIASAQTALENAAEQEKQRLAAIERLHGMGRGSAFGSASIRRDRDEDMARDERSFGEHFGPRP